MATVFFGKAYVPKKAMSFDCYTSTIIQALDVDERLQLSTKKWISLDTFTSASAHNPPCPQNLSLPTQAFEAVEEASAFSDTI